MDRGVNRCLFIAISLAVETEKSWVVKMHPLVKGVLRSFVLSILPHRMLGEKQSMAARIGELGWWCRLMDLLSLVFRYGLAFYSHPTRTSTEAHLPTVFPSPLPVVAFQCKWVDEWLQLAHQKASPAEGPWWLRLSQATLPLPSPTQHFVPSALPSVSVYTLCLTRKGRLGIRGLKESDLAVCLCAEQLLAWSNFLKWQWIPDIFYLSQGDKAWLWSVPSLQ